jgi:hypothetical protein
MTSSARERLEAAAEGIPLADLRGTGRKSTLVQFRVTLAEKASLQRTADALGVSVSEYLLRLHTLVSPKLSAIDGASPPTLPATEP